MEIQEVTLAKIVERSVIRFLEMSVGDLYIEIAFDDIARAEWARGIRDVFIEIMEEPNGTDTTTG